MKIVFNYCFGGYFIPYEWVAKIGAKGSSDDSKEVRTNKLFVQLVENCHYDDDEEDRCTELRVADIPDRATDWMVTEYDGLETVYYVLDGKIRRYQPR